MTRKQTESRTSHWRIAETILIAGVALVWRATASLFDERGSDLLRWVAGRRPLS